MAFVVDKSKVTPPETGTGKPAPKANKPDGPRQASKPLMIGAGVFVVLLLGFFIHHFVTPVVPQSDGKTHVAPPPGYPDTYPYNTAEWQKSGNHVRLSGIPPGAMSH